MRFEKKLYFIMNITTCLDWKVTKRLFVEARVVTSRIAHSGIHVPDLTGVLE